MKRKTGYSVALGILAAIISLFLAYGTQIGFQNVIPSIVDSKTAVEKAEPEYTGFDVEQAVLKSTTDDSYVVYSDVNSYVSKFELSLKTDGEPVDIKVYYRGGEEFSEEKSVEQTAETSDSKLTFSIGTYVTDLRIDLGSAAGQQFEIKNIELVKRDFLKEKGTWTIALIFTLCLMFVFAHFIYGPAALYTAIDRYRYWIAAGALLLLVALELSGSSISMWNNNISMENDGLLLGVNRPIRSDEWAVNTPMTISQYYDGYSSVSNIIRGTLTDVSIVYGQPAFSLNLLFRLFSVGYVLLGSSYGLAFFWYGRLIALFLVTYEFVKWMTNGNKQYAALGSILITFAPIVQWWFAINGLVEMLIAAQLSILFLDKYIKTENSKKRVLYFLVILLSAGNFVLTFYPSWMIPVAYIILGFVLWVFIENWSILKFKKIDILSILLMTGIFVAAIGFIFYSSKDTIESVMNTVYPGSRMETGGGYEVENIWGGFTNLFFPFRPYADINNTSEQAVFLDLFPLGLLLSLFYMFKTKKKDSLMIIMIGLSLFFLVWMTVGYPEIIAKITFLNRTQSRRAYLGFGLANTFLLLRTLSVVKFNFKWQWGVLIAGVYAAFAAVMNRQMYPIFLHHPLAVTAVFVLAFGMGLLVVCLNKRAKLVVFGIGAIVLGSGLTVNPVQQSTAAIEESDLANSLKAIQKEEPGKWIVEGMSLPTNNLLIMFGLPTINSTNVYPNMELWKKIDPQKEYEEVYNRYAHIIVRVLRPEEEAPVKFELIQPDVFQVNVTIDELATIDAGYILTRQNFDEVHSEQYKLHYLYDSEEGYRVYKLVNN